jgi:hypothetical protein
VVAGFEAARQILEEADPDAIVVFSNDHFDRCFYDNLPAFLSLAPHSQDPPTKRACTGPPRRRQSDL